MKWTHLLYFFSIGTNTIAMMTGSECYGALRISFRDCWDCWIEILPGHTVPVEFFLGGDSKVITHIVTETARVFSTSYCLMLCRVLIKD